MVGAPERPRWLTRITTGLAIASLTHLVTMIYWRSETPHVPAVYFWSHLSVVSIAQVAVALLLGSILEGRAWAAAVFALPLTLIALPGVLYSGGWVRALLLVAGIVAAALWCRLQTSPGSPLFSGLLGATTAAELLRIGHGFTPTLSREPSHFAFLALLLAAALGAGLAPPRWVRSFATTGPRTATAVATLALLAAASMMSSHSATLASPDALTSAANGARPPICS